MADSPTLSGDLEQVEITDIITKGIAYAIIAAGLLSVVFIFVGGISFILSGGQEDKIKQAVSTIRYAIFGLIITIFAVVIVAALGKILDLDLLNYIDITEVFNTVRNIGNSGDGGSVDSLD